MEGRRERERGGGGRKRAEMVREYAEEMGFVQEEVLMKGKHGTVASSAGCWLLSE